MAESTSLLFNPRTYDPAHFDPETRRLLRATVDWFEARGKRLDPGLPLPRLAGRLPRIRREGGAVRHLPDPRLGCGLSDGDRRWDTARIAALNEIFGFYGLDYWYAWQVTVLGLGPVWQSDNADARERAARLLARGEVFAFGLSERTHGADIYSTDMLLEPDADVPGGFRATGSKYYIGNGNAASPGLRLRPPHRRRGPRRLRLLRRRQPPPGVPPAEERRRLLQVRQRVPPEGLPGGPRRRPAHGPRRLRRRAQHRQRRQVQPLHRLHRHLRARDVRGRHPRDQPHPLRPPRHRVPARAPRADRRLRPARRDEAVQRPRRGLLPLHAPTTAATCSSTR